MAKTLILFEESRFCKRNSKTALVVQNNAVPVASSVRRIFERGRAGNSENLRITETRMKFFPPRISQFFLSKKTKK